MRYFVFKIDLFFMPLGNMVKLGEKNPSFFCIMYRAVVNYAARRWSGRGSSPAAGAKQEQPHGAEAMNKEGMTP